MHLKLVCPIKYGKKGGKWSLLVEVDSLYFLWYTFKSHNCASQGYFGVIDTCKLNGKWERQEMITKETWNMSQLV